MKHINTFVQSIVRRTCIEKMPAGNCRCHDLGRERHKLIVHLARQRIIFEIGCASDVEYREELQQLKAQFAALHPHKEHEVIDTAFYLEMLAASPKGRPRRSNYVLTLYASNRARWVLGGYIARIASERLARPDLPERRLRILLYQRQKGSEDWRSVISHTHSADLVSAVCHARAPGEDVRIGGHVNGLGNQRAQDGAVSSTACRLDAGQVQVGLTRLIAGEPDGHVCRRGIQVVDAHVLDFGAFR